MIVVLMGVSGVGKTMIGKLLANRMGWIFADADDYHSAGNKQKMAAGIPLDDQDRAPWLDALNRLLREWSANGQNGVLACSALKQTYREKLASGIPPAAMRFVWLDADKELIHERMIERHHEYMNPALLDSQLATLEAPKDALRVVNDRAPEAVAEEIAGQLSPAP